jgi:hypothetical protein
MPSNRIYFLPALIRCCLEINKVFEQTDVSSNAWKNRKNKKLLSIETYFVN